MNDSAFPSPQTQHAGSDDTFSGALTVGDAPSSDLPLEEEQGTAPIPTYDTLLPRHIAAVMDNCLALTLFFVVAKQVTDAVPGLPMLAAVAAYLGYFWLLEGVTGRTVGKLMTGLVVVGMDGRRCTWGQTSVRTFVRVLEVNPLLLGALPAALSIFLSKDHQRMGDRAANTLVVASHRVK